MRETCYNHPAQPAVTTCAACERPTCAECTHRDGDVSYCPTDYTILHRKPVTRQPRKRKRSNQHTPAAATSLYHPPTDTALRRSDASASHHQRNAAAPMDGWAGMVEAWATICMAAAAAIVFFLYGRYFPANLVADFALLIFAFHLIVILLFSFPNIGGIKQRLNKRGGQAEDLFKVIHLINMAAMLALIVLIVYIIANGLLPDPVVNLRRRFG